MPGFGRESHAGPRSGPDRPHREPLAGLGRLARSAPDGYTINVGNWMYFWALELVAGLGIPDQATADLRGALGSGLFRCHFGQALDLARPVGRIPQDEMVAVVSHVTRRRANIA